MKKTMIKILAAVCVFVLSGCVRMRMSMDVSSSGDVKSGVTLLFHEDLMNFNGANVEEQIDAMMSQYREKYPDAVIKKAEEKDGDTVYAGVSVSGIVNDALKADVSEGMVTLRLPVSALTNEFAASVLNGVNYSLNDLKEHGAQITLDPSAKRIPGVTVRKPAPHESCTLRASRGEHTTPSSPEEAAF